MDSWKEAEIAATRRRDGPVGRLKEIREGHFAVRECEFFWATSDEEVALAFKEAMDRSSRPREGGPEGKKPVAANSEKRVWPAGLEEAKHTDTRFELDTGASLSIIDEKTWRKLGRPQLQKAEVAATAFDNKRITFQGKFPLHISSPARRRCWIYMYSRRRVTLCGRDMIRRLQINCGPHYELVHNVKQMPNVEIKKEIVRVLDSNKRLFQDALGKCTIARAKFKFKSDPVVPKFLRARPVPIALRPLCSPVGTECWRAGPGPGPRQPRGAPSVFGPSPDRQIVVLIPVHQCPATHHCQTAPSRTTARASWNSALWRLKEIKRDIERSAEESGVFLHPDEEAASGQGGNGVVQRREEGGPEEAGTDRSRSGSAEGPRRGEAHGNGGRRARRAGERRGPGIGRAEDVGGERCGGARRPGMKTGIELRGLSVAWKSHCRVEETLMRKEPLKDMPLEG
ncbi:hypothetical protein OSTOST_05676 [Ostertagia ostertagi]